MKIQYWLLIIIFGLGPVLVNAQQHLPKEVNKTFKLEGEDFTEILEFLVPRNSENLNITARGSNRNGSVIKWGFVQEEKS